MSELIKKDKTKTKRQVTYERIKEEIINHKLNPGTLLVERQLCEALQTSRTPIREALHQLANEGFVDFIPGKGAIVSDVTYENIIEIYQIREVLEGLACRLCALAIDNEQRNLLEKKYEDTQKAAEKKDYLAMVNNDLEFHKCIINNSRSEKLKNMMSNIQDQIKRIAYYGDTDDDIKMSAMFHKRILEAIKQKDGESAEQLMREHISISKQRHIEKIYRNI